MSGEGGEDVFKMVCKEIVPLAGVEGRLAIGDGFSEIAPHRDGRRYVLLTMP